MESSLVVAVDGAGTDAWSYDAFVNELVLDDVVKDSTVTAAYNIESECP